MLKKTAALVSFAALLVAFYSFYQPETGEEFVLEQGYDLLYEDGSLARWRVIGGESTFEASGEEIIGRSGPGENTFLRTEKTYTDFSLRLQMRWDELGNSGVLFRAKQKESDGRAYGYQFEMDPSERSWSGGIYDEARRGWLADLDGNEKARKAIRLDGWNDIEIEARGATLKTWINGVMAAEVVDPLDAEGFIALQVHSGGEGQMRWRHLRIRELPQLGHPAEGLGKVDEWRLRNIDNFSVGEQALSGELSQAPAHITPRRQFRDAQLRVSLSVCDQPATIRMRYHSDGGGTASFAEAVIYADRVEVRLAGAGVKEIFESIPLAENSLHEFAGVAVGADIRFTVDGKDVLLANEPGLTARGQVVIEPAACGDTFELSGFELLNYREKSDQLLFYQTLDNAPASVLSPTQALASFSIAPGFEVELVAAEPLVEDPVAMAWDEYGRLYVVEMRGYMTDPYGTGSEEPVGKIVRLEDVDGDGRMDTSDVFLGALVNPRAVAVVNGGILIGEPPNLWLCELPSREALCTNKKRVHGYAVDFEQSNVEHLENGLYQGLDNWLYNARSARRLQLSAGVVQELSELHRGQWGITTDNFGRLLYNHNSTWVMADLFAAEDFVEPGGNTLFDGLGLNLTPLSEVFSVRVNPGVNRAYLDGTLREDGRLHKATGVSGITVYRGNQFPRAYRNDVFVPEVAGNVVAQFALLERGMELTATQRLYEDEKWGQRDFLASTDERFRPVNALNGPDGALYIIDMYRGIVQDDHFLTQELREQIFQRALETPIGLGRIWRIRHKAGSAQRGTPQLAGASDSELVQALASDNGWVRDTAQRLLLARAGNIGKALVDMTGGESTLGAIHAIWTLQGRAELEHDTVVQLAMGGDPWRQIHALRAGRSLLNREDVETLYNALESAGEDVQMQLALVLGDHAQIASVRARLIRILDQPSPGNYLRQAVVRALRGVELAALQEFFAAGAWSEPSNENKKMLATLAANAYRTITENAGTADAAEVALVEFLSLAESRRNALVWQQIAMLEGLARLSKVGGFTPAELKVVPAIFADSSIGEDNPLWEARLTGRRVFTWPGDELALGLTPLSQQQLRLVALGKAFYKQCAACHGESGLGNAGLAPALAGASWVTGPPEWLGRIILQGMSGPVKVGGGVFNGLMPPHGHISDLGDDTLAGLMTYMRRNWGNKSAPVSTREASAIRAASAARTAPWTAPELELVPFDRGFNQFPGEFSISFVTLTVTEEADGLHLAVPMYGSGLMTQLGATRFAVTTGGEKIEIEFIVEIDGAVEKLILYREGQEVVVSRK